MNYYAKRPVAFQLIDLINKSIGSTAAITKTVVDQKTIQLTNSGGTSSPSLYSLQGNTGNIISGHKYYLTADITCNIEAPVRLYANYPGSFVSGTTIPDEEVTISGIVTATNNATEIYLFPYWGLSTAGTYTIKNWMCLDLTAMYGAGFEPEEYFPSKPWFNAITNNPEMDERMVSDGNITTKQIKRRLFNG